MQSPILEARKECEDVRVAVLPKHEVVDTGNIVENYFWDSRLRDGFLEGSCQSGLVVGHVGDVRVYRGSGGIRADEGYIAGEVGVIWGRRGGCELS